MAIWKLLSETDSIHHFPSGARPAAQLVPNPADSPRMEGVSLDNVNGSQPAVRDHGPTAPQLASSGMLGTRLDAWA